MKFDGDIDWKQMKEMFKQISGKIDILDGRTYISAKKIRDLNIRNIRGPNTLAFMYNWMKNLETTKAFCSGKEKIYSLEISLRKFPDGKECMWNIYIEDDGKFYSTEGTLLNKPKNCRYRKKNHCGNTCEILYRGFAKGDFNYEDITAGSRGPENKGSPDSKGAGKQRR